MVDDHDTIIEAIHASEVIVQGKRKRKSLSTNGYTNVHKEGEIQRYSKYSKIN